MLVSAKAKLPNYSQKLKRDFNFTDDQLIQIYSLPHTVAFEPYLKAFQYKALNAILFTNTKLYKIGFIEQKMISVLSADTNQKLYTTLWFIVLIQNNFGPILNLFTFP